MEAGLLSSTLVLPLHTPLLPREYDDARREDEDRVGGCVLFCGVNLHGFHEQVLAVAFNEPFPLWSYLQVSVRDHGFHLLAPWENREEYKRV